jgi:hypothetical protein
MAPDRDPYRTLGLASGASLDEVKRAYRRLAKANHPDAAGSGALARFLAIQAAYERLVAGPAGPGAKPRSGGSTSAARRASAADPDRAEATRRAYGGRARTRRPADAQPGRGPATDGGPADPEAARGRGKATLGSTSYDDANAGSVDPDWSGASWYGTTSGTYWTINPKEYADPRKHGPEYQARARRASGARTGSDSNAGATTGSGTGSATGSAQAHAAGPRLGVDDGPPAPVHGPSSWWSSTSGQPGPEDTTSADRAGTWEGVRPTVRRRSDGIPPLADEEVPDPGRALAILARALTDPRTGGLRGRIIRAIVGWLPLALGIGWAIGEFTGCSRFAATCDPAVGPLVLLGQGAALVALLLSPSLASLAAAAALWLLVAAVAATFILSATGTAADEESRRQTVALLFLFAWLAGLAIAIGQRLRTASSRVGPVS